MTPTRKEMEDAQLDEHDIKATLKNFLLDCPFCACWAYLTTTHMKYWWGECSGCGAQTQSRYGRKRGAAEWNRRPY